MGKRSTSQSPDPFLPGRMHMGVDFVYRDHTGQVDGARFGIEGVEERRMTIGDHHPSQQFEGHAEYRPKPVAELLDGKRHAGAVVEYNGTGGRRRPANRASSAWRCVGRRR